MPTISRKHQQVCDLILAGQSEGKAYAQVYGKDNYGAAKASVNKMLRRPEVVEYMERARAQVTEAVVAAAVKTATDVLADLEAIADADSRELMEYRRGCCRHCWGKEFLYQRTPQELRDYIKKQNETNEKRLKDNLPPEPLDEGGGIGYNRTRQPNPECPECFGEGQGYEFFKDTRTVSPAAAKLFAGVKVKNNGLEFVTHSQERARELLARHHGLLDKKGDTGDTPEALAAEVRRLVDAAAAVEGAPDGSA
ncbi:terminase small subunit [Massilia sp. METH4]|uniref:terminase small subunit n=1 Tax=Massilia sp. METH4 TaxID=3123041 RepID=UPI0030CB621E